MATVPRELIREQEYRLTFSYKKKRAVKSKVLSVYHYHRKSP